MSEWKRNESEFLDESVSRYHCPHCDEWMDSSERVRHRPCPNLVRMLDVTHSRAVERVAELETAVYEVLEFLVAYGGGSGNTVSVVEILAAVWPWDDQSGEGESNG